VLFVYLIFIPSPLSKFPVKTDLSIVSVSRNEIETSSRSVV